GEIAEDRARVDDGRERRGGYAQSLEDRRAPAVRQEIVEAAARGVRAVGREAVPAGQARREPRVERAAPQPSAADAGPVGIDAVEYPLDLGRRREWADEDALAHERLAARRRPAVLPRQRRGDGAAGGGVPDE